MLKVVNHLLYFVYFWKSGTTVLIMQMLDISRFWDYMIENASGNMNASHRCCMMTSHQEKNKRKGDGCDLGGRSFENPPSVTHRVNVFLK